MEGMMTPDGDQESHKPETDEGEVYVEYMRLDEIHRDPTNPKEHDLGALTESLKRFGFVAPMGMNEQTGLLLFGHGRLDDLEDLCRRHESPPGGVKVDPTDGMWIAPVVRGIHMSPDEGSAYIIADNRLVELGGWNEPMLLARLVEIAGNIPGEGLVGTGFDGDDVRKLIECLAANQIDTEPEFDRAAELLEKWQVKTGDLWLIGEHRLLCADSTNPDDVERVLEGATPFLCVTDPPYGVDYDPQWRSDAAKHGLLAYAARRCGVVANDDRADWREAWALFPGDVIYSWHPPGATSLVHAAALQESGFIIRTQIIWAKSNFPIGRGDYHVRHEPCWYAVRKGKASRRTDDRTQTTLWEINLDKNVEGGHSTQKPLECMARPIRNHDAPEVYDPFLGSGTTMVACQNLDRKCFGIEISPAYCSVVLERMFTAFPSLEIRLGRAGDHPARVPGERLGVVGRPSGEPLTAANP